MILFIARSEKVRIAGKCMPGVVENRSISEAPDCRDSGLVRVILMDEAHNSCNTAEGRVGGTSVLFTDVPPSPTIFSHSLRKGLCAGI